jgi:HEAT repeat protein
MCDISWPPSFSPERRVTVNIECKGRHSLRTTAFQIQKQNPKVINLKHSSRTIAEAGHRGDTQLVGEALHANEPEIRRAALGAAKRLNILDNECLSGFLGDKDLGVRRRALELAARTKATPALVRAVAALLDDEQTAELAAFVIGELGTDDTTVVIQLEHHATSHEDALCRESAVAALGSLGVGKQAVLAATGDVATVRRRAIIALANFEGEDVEAAISAALDDRDWQVRQISEDLVAGPEAEL